MKKQILMILPLAAMLLLWNACKKEEQNVAPPPPDNEVITTVKLVATNTADATDVQTVQWKDLTPNDGNPDLSQAMLNLKKNAVYTVALDFLDETKSPADTITTEVRERANYHLICFSPATGLHLTVQRTDHDSNTPAMEIGLQSKFTTTDTSTGNLQVALHHQPDIKNGIDCNLGSTDAEVNFTVHIQ